MSKTRWILFVVVGVLLASVAFWWRVNHPSSASRPPAPKRPDENQVLAKVGDKTLTVKDVRKMEVLRSLSTGAPPGATQSVRVWAERLALSMAAEKAGVTVAPEALRAASMQKKMMMGILANQLQRAGMMGRPGAPTAMVPSPPAGMPANAPLAARLPLGVPSSAVPGMPSPQPMGMPRQAMPGMEPANSDIGSADPLARGLAQLKDAGLTEKDLLDDVTFDLLAKGYVTRFATDVSDAGSPANNPLEARQRALAEATKLFPIQLEK